MLCIFQLIMATVLKIYPKTQVRAQLTEPSHIFPFLEVWELSNNQYTTEPDGH